MSKPSIRLATAADLPAISAIYNHFVLRSTCTYQEEPDTPAERSAWFAAHGPEHPAIVAEQDGALVGWASLSRFSQRCAYRYSVENSVYVDYRYHGQGIGRALLAELLRLAQELGYHSVIAVISADQGPSLALHERCGFERVGVLREVGFKFGRWLDAAYMQKWL